MAFSVDAAAKSIYSIKIAINILIIPGKLYKYTFSIAFISYFLLLYAHT